MDTEGVSRVPLMDTIQVRESQVEDILGTFTDMTAEVLGIREELTLLNRQKILPSGNRIDLLFVSGTRLKLVELKVEGFKDNFLQQVIGYREELGYLQNQDKLIKSEIDCYLLCTLFRNADRANCEESLVIPILYSPEFILQLFYQRLKNVADFLNLKPADHGLWNLHLLNKVLYQIGDGKSKSDLARDSKLSVSTVGSYLRFAKELKLVELNGTQKVELNKLGKTYVLARGENASVDETSEAQVALLKEFIVRDPFASRAIFGIYTLVETIFTLSRNIYPVPWKLAVNSFRENSGKTYEWASYKSASDATKMYSNYASELGLIGRIGQKFYMTPDGVRFILLLQLHKALKVLDALKVR